MTESQKEETLAEKAVDKWRRQREKLDTFGQRLLHRLTLNTVSRMTESPPADQVIEMTTQPITLPSDDERQTPQQLLKQQIPGLTRQLLGKRFDTMSRFAQAIVPYGTLDILADQALAMLTDFASLLGDSYQVLHEAGVDSLSELQHDPDRSGRLAGALGNQSKLLGMVQGAVSGAFGTVGAAVDLPLSMLIALRTIYLTGRAYGFDLDRPEDRALVYEALAKADLSLVAEKQAIFLGLKTIGGLLNTGDLQYLQSLVGSNNNIEPLRKLLSDEAGQLKWKLNPALLSKIAPLAGGAAGAIYNARFIEQVAAAAREVFENARVQTLHHPAPTNDIDALLDSARKHPTPEELAAAAQLDVLENPVIEKVEIEPRAKAKVADAQTEAAEDKQVEAGIAALAEKLVEPASQPATKPRATRRKTTATGVGSQTASATKKAPVRKKPAASKTEVATKVENSVDSKQDVANAPVAKPTTRRQSASKTTQGKVGQVKTAGEANTDKPAATRKRSSAKAATPDKGQTDQ